MNQFFEPYGEDNTEPLFLIRELELNNIQIIGKSEKKHLKLRVGKKI